MKSPQENQRSRALYAHVFARARAREKCLTVRHLDENTSNSQGIRGVFFRGSPIFARTPYFRPFEKGEKKPPASGLQRGALFIMRRDSF